jgi:hypothetical protein
MALLIQRMLRAARLDSAFYEEVEADKSAMGQAMLVVGLSSLAAGLGAGGQGVKAILVGVVAAWFGWLLWAWLTWFIGTKLLPEAQTDADLGQLLRTTGFSAAPGLLRLFAFLPVVGRAVTALAQVWMLVAMVVAVRQALDYRGTGRTLAVCLIGWLIYVIVGLVVAFAVMGRLDTGGLAA